MKAAEFEEKEYEGPLYNQLERGNRLLWSPGQVLEEYLGFDRAFMLEDSYLWRLHEIRRPYRGLSPYFSRWPFLPPERRHRNRLPRFRVNCFIQAKRSEFGKRLTKRLASLGERRPFFRFGIESDQQTTLEAAASRLRGKALFVYAAPVLLSLAGTLRSHGCWHHRSTIDISRGDGSCRPRRLVLQRARLLTVLGSGLRVRSVTSPQAAARQARRTTKRSNRRGAISKPGSRGSSSPDPDGRCRKDMHAIGPREAYLAEEWRRIDSICRREQTPPRHLPRAWRSRPSRCTSTSSGSQLRRRCLIHACS